MNFQAKSFLLLAISGLASAQVLANGHIDDARQLYYHEVTDSFRELSSALDNGNFDAAGEAAKKLHERTNKLFDFSSMLEKDVQTLTPNFIEDFRGIQKEVGTINAQAGILEIKLGHQNASDDFRVLKEHFDPAGKSLDTLYSKLQDFGKRFQVMCDTCR
jgi:hypothetical protein